MADITSAREHRPASGRFVLRIDPDLHATLRRSAQRLGVSLNDLCAERVGVPATHGGGPGAAVVARAASLFGDTLCGVAAYGSWARDDLAPDSDVDVLVVVDRHVAITRDLYRGWDLEPMRWDGRAVDAHFAHQVTTSSGVPGMWMDVAIDGVVLYDRDLELSRRLVELRARVASGHVVRHYVHGHPYWVQEG